MRRRRFWTGLFGATVVTSTLGWAHPAARADLFAINFNNQLIRINTTTGAGTLIGNIPGGNRFPIGLGFRGNQLYTYDLTNSLIVELDPATAAVLNTINIGIGDIGGEGALDFRSDGIGFLSLSSGATGRLFRFDLGIPNSTPITSAGGLNPSMDGLALDSADVLYGVSQSSSTPGNTRLYTINQTTGVTTLVGSLGLTPNFILGGLTFDLDGTLYAALSENAGSPSFLYRVNKTTGAATLVGNIGFNGVSGLAAVIPEPSSIVLAGLGLLGVVGVVARRQRRRA